MGYADASLFVPFLKLLKAVCDPEIVVGLCTAQSVLMSEHYDLCHIKHTHSL